MRRTTTFLGLATSLLAGSVALALRQESLPPPQPSAEHAQVMRLVGTWTVTVKSGDQTEAEKSTITFERIGEYWVTGRWHGTYMGLPFDGQSTQGYSPTKKKMIATWVDSRTPEVGLGEGTWDPATSTMRISWECATKPDQPSASETVVFHDDDHFTATMSMRGPDGEERPPMTLEYVRKGSVPER